MLQSVDGKCQDVTCSQPVSDGGSRQNRKSICEHTKREIDYMHQRGNPCSMLDHGPAKGRKQTFKTLFCERFECSTLEFESEVFWESLYRHAIPFAYILSRWTPDFFQEDAGFVRDLGGASSRGEVLTELNRFYGRNVRDRNVLRKLLHIRISGRRIQRLARSLFGANHAAS